MILGKEALQMNQDCTNHESFAGTDKSPAEMVREAGKRRRDAAKNVRLRNGRRPEGRRGEGEGEGDLLNKWRSEIGRG